MESQEALGHDASVGCSTTATMPTGSCGCAASPRWTRAARRWRPSTAVPSGRQHGPAANATMVDSDDVLLLRPTDPPHPPAAPHRGPRSAPSRPATSGSSSPPGCTNPATAPATGSPARCSPELQTALGTGVATWRTEPAENTFPALPVRDDHAFVWTATFADHASYAAAFAALGRRPWWQHTDDRARPPRRRRPAPPPPPHRPLCTPAARDYPDSARLSRRERSASLRVREAAVRNSSAASDVRPARERRSPRTACHW